MMTNSGISKATPKTSSIRVMKVKKSPNSVSWMTPAGVKLIRVAMPLGST